jgi:uncharacterized protein (TIGR02466 family)
MNRHEEAEQVLSFDRFINRQSICLGHNNETELSLKLKDQICFNLELRSERIGTATVSGFRADRMYSGDNETMDMLGDIIKGSVHQYLSKVNGIDIVTGISPKKLSLRIWALKLPAQGYEEWHVHSGGWLSGCYYLSVPKECSLEDKRGCIEFGVPELKGMPETAKAFRTCIKPEEGEVIIFPSHFFHRTYPTESQSDRICVGFDIIPGE